MTVKVHFDMYHGFGNLDKAIDVLDHENREDFRSFVNSKGSFNPFNMFICRSPELLNTYYKSLFNDSHKTYVITLEFCDLPIVTFLPDILSPTIIPGSTYAP